MLDQVEGGVRVGGMAVARSDDDHQYGRFVWALPVEMEGTHKGCGGTGDGDDDDDDFDVAPAA